MTEKVNKAAFLGENKKNAKNIILKNGQEGMSIKTKLEGVHAGGFWTEEGKIITFWD